MIEEPFEGVMAPELGLVQLRSESRKKEMLEWWS